VESQWRVSRQRWERQECNYLEGRSELKSPLPARVLILQLPQPEKEPAQREYTQHLVLRDHQYPVGCITWSLDDSMLLTSSDNHIKIWNTRVRPTKCLSWQPTHAPPIVRSVYAHHRNTFRNGDCY